MSQIQVRLSRYDAQPWGFRLQGGTDFGTPLIVQKVNAGSLSEQAGLLPGDQVLSINDVDVYALRHKEAQDLVVRSGNTFTLNVLRGQSTWRPHVTPTGNVPNAQGGHLGNNIPTVTKTSLAHRRPQEEEHIGCGYNNSARPFNAVNGNGPVKSIVNKQYNSPVGIYSDEAIAETLSAQAEVLAEGVLGVNFKKNEKQYNAEKSEVLKFLREAETEPAESAYNNNNHYENNHHQQNSYNQQQHHQHHQQQQQHHQSNTTSYQNSGPTKHVSAPVDQPRPQGTGGHSVGAQNICSECERLIVGVFVRIKDKNLHAECFRCATCGTSLKNQGYYNFNNKLYCDIHAKLAATQNPPSGTDGYVPIPIRPGTKLSANNISAALSAHGYQGIPAAANVPVTYSQQHHQKYQQPQQQQHQPQQQQQQHYAPQPKVNQPFTRPYGSGPVSPHVPTASPKSPQIYPPSTQPDSWNQPRPTPQAQQSPYATLPRTNYGGAAQPQYQRQQEQECTEIYEQKQTTTEQTTLTQQHQTHYFQEEIELTDSRQTKQQNFVWPPPGSEEGTYEVPTAAPLYIPPPETQRVKTVEKVRFEEPEPEPQPQPIVEQPPQWQSRSAPELGSNPPEIASGADSYASTCTSTTTTSDEYQRIYASEQYQRQAYEAHSSYDAMSGRRSAQECVDTLNTPISNYKLVDMVREVTPTPTPKPQKRVEFSEEKKVITIDSQSLSDATEEARFQQIETQRMFQPTPEIKFVIPENRYLPPSNIHNTIPKEYVSPMIQALTTAPDSPVQFIECSCPYSHVEFHPPPPIVSPQQNICQAACQQQEAICQQQSVCQRQSICQEESVCQKTICQEQQQQQEQSTPAILNEEPPKASFISGLMTTAPQEPVHFAPNPDEVIPLPQEQEAYMPPPIDMKPYMREDFRPKSPFLSALIVAPEQPLQPFQREVPSQLLDLPTPTCKLTMADALRIAPERCYSPLSQENSSNFVLDEIPSKPDLEKSAFTNMQEKPFQPAAGPLTQTRQSITSLTSAQKEQIEATRKSVTSIQSNTSVKSNTSIQKTQDHENRRESEHLNMNIQSAPVEERISYPPPSPLHSPHVTHAKHYDAYGLHKPETIPQYQRNWTVLPSQRPVRTPEPPELRENVPLAFIDASPSPTPRPTTETPQFETEQHIEQQRQLISSTNAKSVPIIVEDRSGPVTMTFQSLDSHLQQEDHSRIRSLTPCSQINKPAPIIPFYQAPEKLLFEECDPTKSQLFDRRSVSPYSNRAKSPAPGPPPNPLNSIRAPRLKSPVREGFGGFVANIPRPQAGSIMTGQSAQGQLISNYQASNISGSQSFVNKPEIIQQGTIGDMSYERRENESRMAEEKRAQMESKTTTQVGNAQIQRHRKVIEEYEHTQNQKSIEIRTEFGKPGFVASEARRLSGLDQELTNLSSQSRAISAKAADLTKFPQHQFQTDAKFPTKSLLPSYDEPKQPAYVVPTATPNKVAGQQPGYLAQSQNPYAPSSGYSASSIQQQQKQCSSLMSSSSLNATNSLTNSSAFANTNVSAPSIKPPFGGSIGGGQPIYKPPDSQQLQQRQSSISSTNQNINISSDINSGGAGSNKGGAISARSAPKRGYGILNKAGSMRTPQCSSCGTMIRGPFITALGRIWCPEHFICVRQNCHRPLQDIGFVEEKGDLYCEYCFEQYLAPTCSKCNGKIKGDCLNAIGKHFHPECFNCFYCGKLFGNTPFFLEEGNPYCEADWNELFTTKCFACGFPVEAGDRWVEALNHNYHSQCFNCTMCKKNLEGQSFYNKGGRPFCKNHAR